jgi:hypothetical protein
VKSFIGFGRHAQVLGHFDQVIKGSGDRQKSFAQRFLARATESGSVASDCRCSLSVSNAVMDHLA